MRNIIRLELPDGRLVTIEGGSAPDVAHYIANHYLGAKVAGAPTTNREEPLEAPSMSFEKPAPPQTTSVPAWITANEEEPLELPRMKF